MRALFAALTFLGATIAPGIASACMPPPDYYENRQAYEDRDLNRATVLFRGVIENFQQPGGRYDDVTLTIRRTRTFWGANAPGLVLIPREYFSNCARGNLHPAVDLAGDSPGLPVVRNGLGVTLLGRPGDVSEPWNFVILVDGAPDTQRVLRRFKQLKQTQ